MNAPNTRSSFMGGAPRRVVLTKTRGLSVGLVLLAISAGCSEAPSPATIDTSVDDVAVSDVALEGDDGLSFDAPIPDVADVADVADVGLEGDDGFSLDGDAEPDLAVGPSHCVQCAQDLCSAGAASCLADENCREAAVCVANCGPDEACPANCVGPAVGPSLETVKDTAYQCLSRTDRCSMPCGPNYDEIDSCRDPGFGCVPGTVEALSCCGDYNCLRPSSGDPRFSTHLCVHGVGESCDLSLPNPDAVCHSPSRCDPASGTCELMCWASTDLCWEGAPCCNPTSVCQSPGTANCCIPSGVVVTPGEPCCSGGTTTDNGGPTKCL